MYRILEVREASQRKSLSGLDNTAAEGVVAFERLNSIIDELIEAGGDKTAMLTLKEKLNKSKKYLKTEYMSDCGAEESECADHCRRFALSDPKVPEFQSKCMSHTSHEMKCSCCEELKAALDSLESSIADQSSSLYSEEQRDDLLYDFNTSKNRIVAWKSHILRGANQENAKQCVLRELDNTSMLVVADWAMKFVQMRHREKQSDWYAKRGMSWHISSVVTRDGETDELQVVSYAHLLDSCAQDWYTVGSVFENLLENVKRDFPVIKRVYLRSDEAGCYHTSQLIAAVKDIGDRVGITVERYDFSEPQQGKDICDRVLCPMKATIRKYCSQGHDKKKAVKLNSPAFYNSYKKCRNQVTERIKSAKTQYFKTNLENTKNSKETWDLINNLLNKKQKKTTINNLKIESETITGDENISNAFNNFFVEIGPKLAANIPPSDIDPTEYVRPCITEFNFTAITKTVLAATIKQIHTNKAPGLDKISNKLIKLAGNAVYDSLLHIFNLILDTGIFPEDLKLTRVTPIHKEGDKSKCGNYRPISVIPALAKILEKLICEQINSHIHNNNIICEQQSGFRPGHSTETALLYCTNQWLLNMDKGLINGVLFLDFKKAFDTVDHCILLQKLEKYGIKGTAHKLIRSYLSNRKQVCILNNSKSQQKTVQCGIPQGSNLGPLLFSIYINDLPNCLKHTQASMFADDTNLTCTGSSANEIEHKLNSDLCNVNRWLRANKLTLNNRKTKFMLIASKRKLNQIPNNLQILVNNSLIQQVKQKEVLGVIIDQELNWKEHVDAQCKKLSSAIALLRRAKAFISQNELIRMYNTLVIPYFTYCSNVWYDGDNRTNTEKIYKMQKRQHVL